MKRQNRKRISHDLLLLILISTVFVTSLIDVRFFIPQVFADASLYESQLSGGTQNLVWGVNWFAQEFLVGATSHTVQNVTLSVSQSTTPINNMNVSIRLASSVDHKPTGSDLTSVLVNVSLFPATSGDFMFNLTDYTLSANTNYTIVFRVPSASSNSNGAKVYSTSSSGYAGKSSSSTDGGATWTTSNTVDFYFKIWGWDGTPQYSNVATNSTLNQQPISFSVKWSLFGSSTSMSKGIFSSNVTGSVANDSLVVLSGQTTWFNVTKTPSQNVGDTIEFQEYANSSLNVWNATGWNYLTLTATWSIYWNSTSGAVLVDGVSVSNGSISTFNTPSHIFYAVPQVNFTFVNWTVTYASSTSNSWTTTVVNVTTLWCYFGVGNATTGISPYIFATFTWTPLNPSASEWVTINMTSRSSSSINDYFLDAGDGGGLQDVGSYPIIQHLYLVNATYSVKLIAHSSVGNSSTLTLPIVVGYGQNVSSYSDGYSAGYSAGYSIGWSSGNASGYASGWTSGNATGWIAGNSSGWTSGNATGYTTGYSAGYSVGYSTGFSDGVASVVIPDYSIARFDFVISNFTVSFNASQSYSTVAILNYTWNFGDGNVTTLAGDLVDHTFATNSTYPVILTLGSRASNNSAVVFHDVVVGLEVPSTDDTGFYIAGGFFFAIVILVIAIALSKH